MSMEVSSVERAASYQAQVNVQPHSKGDVQGESPAQEQAPPQDGYVRTAGSKRDIRGLYLRPRQGSSQPSVLHEPQKMVEPKTQLSEGALTGQLSLQPVQLRQHTETGMLSSMASLREEQSQTTEQEQGEGAERQSAMQAFAEARAEQLAESRQERLADLRARQEQERAEREQALQAKQTTLDTDRVDWEINMLKQETERLQRQLALASDDTRLSKLLQEHLQQMNLELDRKDTTTYRRQHAVVS